MQDCSKLYKSRQRSNHEAEARIVSTCRYVQTWTSDDVNRGKCSLRKGSPASSLSSSCRIDLPLLRTSSLVLLLPLQCSSFWVCHRCDSPLDFPLIPPLLHMLFDPLQYLNVLVDANLVADSIRHALSLQTDSFCHPRSILITSDSRRSTVAVERIESL